VKQMKKTRIFAVLAVLILATSIFTSGCGGGGGGGGKEQTAAAVCQISAGFSGMNVARDASGNVSIPFYAQSLSGSNASFAMAQGEVQFDRNALSPKADSGSFATSTVTTAGRIVARGNPDNGRFVLVAEGEFPASSDAKKEVMKFNFTASTPGSTALSVKNLIVKDGQGRVVAKDCPEQPAMINVQ